MPPHLSPSIATLPILESALSSLRIARPPTHIAKRYASHQAQGRANKASDGPGKRLGAKKTSGAYVVPGNILFKQRGTLWFPGDNCYMGRDHTIHAGAPGYVRYYRDPAQPRRKFIGIVFEKDQSLPQPTTAVRRRLLGMLAYRMADHVGSGATGSAVGHSEDGSQVTNVYRQQTTVKTVAPGKIGATSKTMSTQGPQIDLRPGYQYREANWAIGRAGDEVEAAARAKGRTTRTYPDFKRGLNVATYRKSLRRIQRAESAGQQGKKVRAAKRKVRKQ